VATQWSEAEDERLRHLYANPSILITRIAAQLGRTRQAVVKRASELGLRRPADAPHCEDTL
jgi:hypothetical protein